MCGELLVCITQEMQFDLDLQDVTEEVAEVLLGKKANKGIIPQVE